MPWVQDMTRIVALVCVLSLPSIAACDDKRPDNATAGKLAVGTKHSPPFAFKNPDGQWTGISIEMWKHLTDELNLK